VRPPWVWRSRGLRGGSPVPAGAVDALVSVSLHPRGRGGRGDPAGGCMTGPPVFDFLGWMVEILNPRFSLSSAKETNPAGVAGGRRSRRPDRDRRRAPGELCSSSRLNNRQIPGVLGYPPAGDVVCGPREHDRRPEERPSERKARPGPTGPGPEPRSGREVRPEGFSQHTRSAGEYRARPTPVTGTCLLRRIPGSARVLTARRESDAPKSGVSR